MPRRADLVDHEIPDQHERGEIDKEIHRCLYTITAVTVSAGAPVNAVTVRVVVAPT